MRNYLPLIFLVLLGFLFVVLILDADKKEEARQASCREILITGSYFGDPVTKMCGVIIQGHPREADCAPVLALPDFAPLRPCWGAR